VNHIVISSFPTVHKIPKYCNPLYWIPFYLNDYCHLVKLQHHLNTITSHDIWTGLIISIVKRVITTYHFRKRGPAPNYHGKCYAPIYSSWPYIRTIVFILQRVLFFIFPEYLINKVCRPLENSFCVNLFKVLGKYLWRDCYFKTS
jgi:hypothetical protein